MVPAASGRGTATWTILAEVRGAEIPHPRGDEPVETGTAARDRPGDRSSWMSYSNGSTRRASATCWQAAIRQNELGTPVPCLSGPHLLAAKQAANRPQDQADIEFLSELQRLGKL